MYSKISVHLCQRNGNKTHLCSGTLVQLGIVCIEAVDYSVLDLSFFLFVCVYIHVYLWGTV